VNRLVHEFVASSVRRFADRTALVDANGTLTYHAMWDRSRRLASVLRGLGVQRGDRALKTSPERLAACGRPTPFFDVKLADDDGKQVPIGEIGEVWVRGDSVSAEYWHQPEATAKAYVDDWFRMGDLAIADEDGYITIVDRKNDMIISGGLNVYPREVEDILAAHPGVNEVAVIGVPDDKWGESVHACISLRPGASVTLQQLQQHCRDSGLATYKKPLSVEQVDEIPKTAVGKVFRRALRERYWAQHGRRVG